jgi:hypothetical protein
LGFAGHVVERPGAVALRFRRPVGDPPRWGFAVWSRSPRGGWNAECVWVVEPSGFVKLGVGSLLPYLGGPDAYQGYLTRRAEINERAAATRAAKAERKALVEWIAGLWAVVPAVPRAWMTGGLAGDPAELDHLITEGEEVHRDRGRERDRAGG